MNHESMLWTHNKRPIPEISDIIKKVIQETAKYIR